MIDPETTSSVRSQLRDNGVGTVELVRPPANSINVDVLSDLVHEMTTLVDKGSRAIVLCASGRHFCAGADVRSGRDPNQGQVRHVYDVAGMLFDIPVPIVAAVQGAAVGAGFGLALVADARVATPETRFVANFSKLGFHHGFGMSVTLPRVVGESAAARILMLGEPIEGDEALRIGLCDEIAAASVLQERANLLAGRLASSAPLAVRSIRSSLRGDLGERARVAMLHERSEQEWLMTTRDFSEGITAANERRQPKFEGK
jgi:2-(1,2-epoxy-1,2-dihydrophenyl)acetyl-CoA isomerase